MGQVEVKIVQANKAQLEQYINLFWPKLDPQNTGFLSPQSLQTLMVTAYRLFEKQYNYVLSRPLEDVMAEWVGVFDPNRVGQVAKADFLATFSQLVEGRSLQSPTQEQHATGEGGQPARP